MGVKQEQGQRQEERLAYRYMLAEEKLGDACAWPRESERSRQDKARILTVTETLDVMNLEEPLIERKPARR
eukprot:514410-Hanusia_phi.AAC.1